MNATEKSVTAIDNTDNDQITAPLFPVQRTIANLSAFPTLITMLLFEGKYVKNKQT